MKTRFDLTDLYPSLKRVETTIGRNGYPQKLQYAYYCDSKEEMKHIVEELKSEGENVEELFIHKKNGWNLWCREILIHDCINLGLVGDSDSAIYLDMDKEEEEIKEDIFLSLIGDDEDFIADVGREFCDKKVDSFYSDIKNYKNKGEVVVFYDANNEDYVEYVITDDTSGYHDGDVTTYQMAFTVYEKNEEGDEEE